METYELYNGAVTLAFDPIKHYYTINGQKANGVTTVLQRLAKPALIWWAARMASDHIVENVTPGIGLDEVQIKQLAKDALWAHKNKKDAAADMGTWIHAYIEQYVQGENPADPINPKLQKAVRSFKKWYDGLDVQDFSCEQKLCSPTLNLAGTVDWIGKLDGKLTIIDWKTGSGIYPEMLLQMGAYSLMYEEEFGEKVEQVGIVNCSVKSSFGTYFTADVEPLKQIYRQLLELDKQLTKLEEEMK